MQGDSGNIPYQGRDKTQHLETFDHHLLRIVIILTPQTDNSQDEGSKEQGVSEEGYSIPVGKCPPICETE